MKYFYLSNFVLLPPGSPAPAVRWLHNETLMGEERNGFILLESAVSLQEIRSELVLTNLSQTMSGVYTCKSPLSLSPLHLQLPVAGVAINNAGVSAASTNLSVVQLSFIFRFSWEFWFLLLLTFIIVFFIFVAFICKTICRQVVLTTVGISLLLYYLSELGLLNKARKRKPTLKLSFNMLRLSSGEDTVMM